MGKKEGGRSKELKMETQRYMKFARMVFRRFVGFSFAHRLFYT